MKKIVIAAVSFVFSIFFLASGAINVSAYNEAMETRAFDVDMKISEKNVYDITTTIRVFFNEPRHGITYYIPYTGEVSLLINGKDVRSNYRNKISNVSVDGYNFSTDQSNGNFVITIGDRNSYITGEQTYIIHYTCALSADRISSMDYVYWNVLPGSWETPIQSSKVTITMPKKFDSSSLEFISGAYGGIETGVMSFTSSGYNVVANLNRPLEKGKFVTVKINLPEGYFVQKNTDKPMYVIMTIVMLGSFGLILLLWFLYGRDEKIIPVVSFSPPKGMTSAETGYIIDGTIDNRDVVSLLLFWASKGYLALDQIDENDFTIVKKQDLPSTAKTYERTMFNGLFKDREFVTTKELKNTFYTTLDATKSMLAKHFSVNPENNIYTKKSVTARVFSSLLLLVPSAAFVLIGLYIAIANIGWYVAAGIILFVILVCSGGIVSTYDKRKAMSNAKYAAAMAILVILTGAACAALLAIGAVVIGKFALAAMAVALTAISIFFTMRMKTRTAQSNAWMREILGLKNFIEEAELDRIKLLVDENPQYFYDVLPFAYVFGLTDKWAKKFEGIALRQPDWYTSSYGGMNMGYFNAMMFAGALNHSMASVQSNMEIRPAPQGGGGFSSGGGGFSAGGGFSGGGMGGGGGGSW